MKIIVSSFYTQAKFKFKISYKVFKFIDKMIHSNIVIPNNLIEFNKGQTISIAIDTNDTINETFLSEAVCDHKNNFINYTIWLPYYKINDANYLLKEFINELFKALNIILAKYNIPENLVKYVQGIVENEVLKNENYTFEEEELPEIDLSDLDL